MRPALPVNTLVKVTGSIEEQLQPQRPDTCGPETFILVKNHKHNVKLPFLLAMMTEVCCLDGPNANRPGFEPRPCCLHACLRWCEPWPQVGANEGTAYVQWWLPGTTSSANSRGGRKAQVVDLFGPWGPADALSLEEMGALPDPVVKTTDVLEWGFDLTVDHELTFETLDAVMDKHRIDITGLSLTSTSRGNRYRTYRLMRN